MVALAGLLCFASIAPAAEEAENPAAEDQSNALRFAIKKTRNPIFPVSLRHEGVQEGHVIFLLHVNENNELEDYLLLEASRLEFATAVERAMQTWDFTSPTVDGQPISVAGKLTVRFERSGMVVLETSGYNLPPGFLPSSIKRIEYQVREIRELDSIPEPIHIHRPDFHVDLLDERDVVTAVFEFYIDTDGRVRIPTLRHADPGVDELLLLIAQESLLQWRFNAPTVRGNPVVAKAAQPFRFRQAAELPQSE